MKTLVGNQFGRQPRLSTQHGSHRLAADQKRRRRRWSSRIYDQFAAVYRDCVRRNHARTELVAIAGRPPDSVCRKKRTTIVDPQAARAEDLVNRKFNPIAPNVLWVADFT